MSQENSTLAQLSRDVFNLFGMWHIDPKDQIVLLGLPENIRPRSLNSYRTQTKTLPDDAPTIERMESFIEMHGALLHAFPHNERLANYWITTKSGFFNDMRPLDVMLNSGIDGIRYVLNHLTQSEVW